MTTEAAARAVLAIFETGELERIEELVDDAFVDHQGLGGKELHGREGFRRAVESVHTNGPVALEIEAVVATDERAAVRVVWRAGGSVRHTIELLRFADGRLVEHWGAELPKS
jgi:predicted SnoaL-like aldol condensation-catalyzing enzyme